MFFTKLGKIAAGIVFVYGLLILLMGIGVATGVIVEPEPGRYLGSHTSGEAIDEGIFRILFSIGLGILAEISMSVVQK
jgi:hypothetical protein